MSQPDLVLDPINPQSLRDLSDEQLDALIAARRERRLKPVREFRIQQEAKRKSEALKTSERLDKHYTMFVKEMERVDAQLAKMEKRVMDIRALRLELGDMTALQEMIDANESSTV